MKSWRTTIFGSGGLLIVASGALSAFFDGDPSTVPNWTVVIGAVSAAIGHFFSRDNKVSSEDAGVK